MVRGPCVTHCLAHSVCLALCRSHCVSLSHCVAFAMSRCVSLSLSLTTLTMSRSHFGSLCASLLLCLALTVACSHAFPRMRRRVTVRSSNSEITEINGRCCPQRSWFWAILEEDFDDAMRTLFFSFVTGSSRPPVAGIVPRMGTVISIVPLMGIVPLTRTLPLCHGLHCA